MQCLVPDEVCEAFEWNGNHAEEIPMGFVWKKNYEMESASASLIDSEKAWPAPCAASKYKLPT